MCSLSFAHSLPICNSKATAYCCVLSHLKLLTADNFAISRHPPEKPDSHKQLCQPAAMSSQRSAEVGRGALVDCSMLVLVLPGYKLNCMPARTLPD